MARWVEALAAKVWGSEGNIGLAFKLPTKRVHREWRGCVSKEWDVQLRVCPCVF